MTTTPLSPVIYCRQCGYDLRAHQPNSEFRTQNSELRPRCPECGRVFDPANPRTFRRRPIRRWLRHVKRAACAVLALALLLAAIWLWLFWGWYDEQQALRALSARPGVIATPSLWLRKYTGPGGFVLDRVADVSVQADSGSADFGPLARLKKLHYLRLAGRTITDLRPLVGLTNFRDLWLENTGVTDLTPLAGLPQLERIALQGTRVSDLRPLLRCRNLREVYLPKETITEEQADELRRTVPGCTVERR